MTLQIQSRKQPLLHIPSMLFLLLLLTQSLIHPSFCAADEYISHDGGLWGSLKDAAKPIRKTAKGLKGSYDGLSDKGRFGVGAAVGFASSRMAIRSTVKAVKTVGAAYIAFEALEYAGILQEARVNYQKSRLSMQDRELLTQLRDYILRTMDGLRHDIRNQLNPKKIKSLVDRGMEKDKAGTVGFGTGAFLGFML